MLIFLLANATLGVFDRKAPRRSVKQRMRYATYLLAAGILAICCCGKNENVPLSMITSQDTTVIPFTEIVLAGTSCQWANAAYDGKVIIINSNADLGKYIVCTEADDFPVDFSKHTVLLAHGMSAGGIALLSKKFLNTECDKYVLEIEITPNDTTIGGEPWKSTLITAKLSAKSNIEVRVVYVQPIEE
jgi:hypothetical protein